MLLDTGADVTLIPSACLNHLKIQADPSQAYELIGFDGTRSRALGVQVDLILLGFTFRGRFLLIDQAEGILGRDILNHLNVTFSGPALQWDVAR